METFVAEQLQLLQQARKLAQQSVVEQGEKYKTSYDLKAAIHKFTIGQKVWLSVTTSIGKNAKLTPNWIRPYKIVDTNDNYAKLQINNKLKVVNIAHIKPFVEEAPKCLSGDDLHSSQGDQHLSKDDPSRFQDQQDQPPSRPLTRAFKKLINLKTLRLWPLHCCQKMNQRNVLVIFVLKITTKIIAPTATTASEIFLACLAQNNSCKNIMSIQNHILQI